MTSRVVVLNKSKTVQSFLEHILRDEGYYVIHLDLSDQVLEDIIQVAPDLIVLDYMFGVDAPDWELPHFLKRVAATRNIPVIISTAAINAIPKSGGAWVDTWGSLKPRPVLIDDFLRSVHTTLRMHRARCWGEQT